MDYDRMIDTARAFYAALTDNNSKDWWDENRETYDNLLKPSAQHLLHDIAPLLAKRTGEKIEEKLFRPNHDVRFSKDKTPYKTHLHVMWTMKTGGRQEPVFFFGVSPDYVTVGGGLMGFNKAVLDDWRKMVDLDGDRIGGIVAALADKGFVMDDPDLKRVPQPYPADHPHADLLRRKGMVARRSLGLGPVAEAIMVGFDALTTFNTMLADIAAG